MDTRDRLSRRDFLGRTALGAAGVGAALTLGQGFAQDAPEARNQRDTMRYRVLGRTNLLVSELSMGGQFLTSEVFAAALDKGVNFVHLSAEYPGAFDGAGPVLADRRDEVFIGLKATLSGVGTPYIDGCLRALGVDHVDFVFVPTISADDARDADGHIRAEFAALKQAGKARFLGLTCHNNVAEVMNAALETDHWDALMLRYGMPFRDELQPLVARAGEKRVGLLAMKSFQAAGGQTRWAAALQTALDNPAVTSVLKGLPSHELLDELAAAVTSRPADQARLPSPADARASRTCVGCLQCAGCPQGVAIEDTLRYAFYYGAELGQYGYARSLYWRLPRERTVLACLDCRRCEARCSRGLPVRSLLREAHALLT